MTQEEHTDQRSRLNRRLRGLAKVIRASIKDAREKDASKELKDLSYLLGRIEEMLADDDAERGRAKRQGKDELEPNRPVAMPVRNSDQYLNTQCEFFDLDANRIQCAIGADLYHCSLRCLYATNVSGSLPPYCTKYMKGRL